MRSILFLIKNLLISFSLAFFLSIRFLSKKDKRFFLNKSKINDLRKKYILFINPSEHALTKILFKLV